jgi:hypothetical protein
VKQKDILLIVVVSLFSAMLSVLLSNFLIVPKQALEQKATVVGPIKPDFEKPDARYFNKDSVDPTQQITIGDNNNPVPFNNSNR